MKKILAITVAFMYLAITSGLVLHIHYCMGEQTGTSVKFAEINSQTCGKCGMEKGSNKCCHDEIKFLKLQDVHKQVNADYQIAPPPAIVHDYNLIDASTLFNAVDECVSNNSPPDDDAEQVPIFLLNGVFRI